MSDETPKGLSETPAPFAGAQPGAKPGRARRDRLKVRKIGNSLGVVLPKETLAKLRVGEGDELQAVETDRGVELSAFDADLDDAMKWIEKGARRYRNTLRALAK